MAAADLDGDGLAEILLGAIEPSAPGTVTVVTSGSIEPGRVAVFRGPVPSSTVDEGDADVVLSGSAAPDRFGHRLVSAELDDDGRMDSSCPRRSTPERGFVAGAVTIIVGGGL